MFLVMAPKLFKCFFPIILVLIANVVSSQTSPEKKQYLSISSNYAFGNILQTTDFVKGDNLMGEPMKNYQSISLKALWQNPGYTDWQKVFRSPYYGFGISYSDFFNPREVGNPISIYGVLGIPVKRWKQLSLYSEFQFGYTFNWIRYDSITNPKNLVIGGGMTVHLNLGFNAYYAISKHLDLGAAVSFIHFSNGGMERPNRGFNLYAPSLELKYHFRSKPDYKLLPKAERLTRSNDLYFMLGYGNHQLVEHELDTNYFAIGGISILYSNQLSNAFRLAYGVDVNYWWGLNARPDGTIGPRTLDNFTLGWIVQPEIIIDRLSLVGGIGIYMTHLNYGNFQQTYQRLGVRYEIYKSFSLGFNVRAINFMLAEFLEFNMGYKIKWLK